MFLLYSLFLYHIFTILYLPQLRPRPQVMQTIYLDSTCLLPATMDYANLDWSRHARTEPLSICPLYILIPFPLQRFAMTARQSARSLLLNTRTIINSIWQLMLQEVYICSIERINFVGNQHPRRIRQTEGVTKASNSVIRILLSNESIH